MDKKILAVAAVAVVVVAAAACVLVLNNGKSGEPASDYTLLDSEDKITAGYSYTMTNTSSNGTVRISITVKSVTDGTATYTIKENSTVNDLSYILEDFGPTYFEFDYTDSDSIPDWASVSVKNKTYTINGTDTDEQPDYTVSATYENLVIVLNDSNEVTSVSGTYKSAYSEEKQQENMTRKFTTTDGELTASVESSESITTTSSVSTISNYQTKFSESKYTTIITDKATEKFGNVDATVYTLNGTYGDSTYENVKYYVYNGFVIHLTGVIDGKDRTTTVSVHL